MADERLAEGKMPNQGDHVNQNLVMRDRVPGVVQVRLAESGVFENQAEFLRVVARQRGGTLAEDRQGGDAVFLLVEIALERVEIILRRGVVFAIALRDADDMIRQRGDILKIRRETFVIQQLKQFPIGLKPAEQFRERRGGEFLEIVFRRFVVRFQQKEVLQALFRLDDAPRFALQFRQNFVANRLHFLRRCGHAHLFDQFNEALGNARGNRLHGRNRLKRVIQPDRVVNRKRLFADLVAAARGAA